MNTYLSKIMTYHQVRQLYREGFSITAISHQLGLNWRTVKHLLSITDDSNMEGQLQHQSRRDRVLQPYEGFVKSKLELYPDTSSAQMHDWLKEHFSDFPVICPKTVFNFVAVLRQKYRLLKLTAVRQCALVEETPYGLQAQVDFGTYNLRDGHGKRVKVHFLTLVLSRSRYKFAWFCGEHFTTQSAIQAHEQAFAFIQGIPNVMVYDQDRVFMVEENKGDLVLTEGFKSYTRERGFKLHFCRKADPQSKGKVENVVKYIKQNFLYNRSFHDIDTLNTEVLGWLERTANAMVHKGTQKRPAQEWAVEKGYLRPFFPLPEPPASLLSYTVRKDNSITYKGNFYSLPSGTYKGRGSKVMVGQEDSYLLIHDEAGRLLCRHELAEGKGGRVIQRGHKRENERSIQDLIEQVCSLLSDTGKGRQFMEAIREDKPRYMRDQLLSIRKTIETSEGPALQQALDYCVGHHITSASDFKSLVQHYSRQQKSPSDSPVAINPFSGRLPEAALIQPQASSISDYDMF